MYSFDSHFYLMKWEFIIIINYSYELHAEDEKTEGLEDWITWPGWPADVSQARASWAQCCALICSALPPTLVVRIQEQNEVESKATMFYERFLNQAIYCPGFSHIFSLPCPHLHEEISYQLPWSICLCPHKLHVLKS